jgi:hypothetical protein
MTTKIIIAGGRDFCNPKDDPNWIQNEQRAFRQLSALLWGWREGDAPYSYSSLEIVSGAAPGADRVGERFATGNGIALKKFPADWDKHGRAAGPIRNGEMGDYADRLIAFWDGESRGTKNMIETAKEKGLIVRVIKYE